MTPQQRYGAQEISHTIITAAMRVHSELGPELLESTYKACLRQELLRAGLRCEIELGLPVVYHGESSISVTASIFWCKIS